MILHIDMDAFFASVEQLDNPDLRGRCVIVGGQSNRGVVAAASYEARKYGIHSAMPIFQAKKKCARLVIVPPRRARYSELSKRIMAILQDFTPLVEKVSIDEAFMDITGCARLYGSPREIAGSIKEKIEDTVHLTCSVGIAPSKFLAKIASDMDKPDGLFIVMPDEAAQFIESLPIRKVSGVGRMTRQKLEGLGIKTLGDVKRYPATMLGKRLGKFGRRLIELANGVDDAPVTPSSPAKSVSSEETLPADTGDKRLLHKYLLRQAQDVGRQLRKLKVKARTITLKIKLSDFKQSTKSVTLPSPTQSSETIYREAGKLLHGYTLIKNVRLIGVGASGLVAVNTPVQMGLFDDPGKPARHWDKVEEALDAITGKFGKHVITRASLKEK